MEQRYSQSQIQPTPQRPLRDTSQQHAAHPEYSWEHLTPRHRRQVMAMIHHSSNAARSRLIALLFALFLALAVIAVVGYLTFFTK